MPQGGVGLREEWVKGKGGPQGGVSHREEWATGRSGSKGRVCHREEWDTGRSGPQVNMSTQVTVGNPQSSSHESLGPFSHYAPYVAIRRTGIT